MPLSERSLDLLNQLKSDDHTGTLEGQYDAVIKDIFKKILSYGDVYKIHDIEDWLNANLPANHVMAERILNVAHYQKAKYDANNPLKMAHDSCGCGGDC